VKEQDDGPAQRVGIEVASVTDVFINYRTKDEESVATLVERDLSTRFGKEKIFRDNRSIEAGTQFQPRLLGAVHGSRALLAVIGPAWADISGPRGKLLDDENDWVRRELVEARAYHVRVIPVLVGEDKWRLAQVELPAELSWLRDLQYRQFAHSRADECLDRIAEDLISFVPGLRPRAAAEPANHTTVQGNQTNFTDNHGQVHSGSGHQFNGTNHISGLGDHR
jgi:hypothetical protein